MRAFLFLALLAMPLAYTDEPDTPPNPERVAHAAGEKVMVSVEKFDVAIGAKNWVPATVVEINNGKYTVKTDAMILGQQTFRDLEPEQVKKKLIQNPEESQ